MIEQLDPLSRQWPALVACAAGLVLAVRVWQVLVPRIKANRPLRNFGRGEESATATLDFILTFPLFTMIILTVVQFALMVNARIVVSYAAYTAARSAIVNTDGGLAGAEAHAEAAAEIGCLPISPQLVSGLTYPNPALALLVMHSAETPKLPGSERLRRWYRSGGKHLYAQLATEVEITGADPEGNFAPKVPVTVKVSHAFRLSVPYADRVFAALVGDAYLGQPVVTITDSYTFLNEGKVRTEAKHEVPRCKSGAELLSLKGLADLLLDVLGL
ncbi:MAG: pilus assembly protein [bacterium]|nr:pilus assembly protein [bacterium]